MAVSSVTATAATTATSDSSRQQIASNFQDFLTLLTTQLKNQNPLDPLSTNEFTQQLVQFASVEQQLKTNDTLSSLLTSTRAQTLSTAVGFVGKEIVADGSATTLANGKANWNLNLPRAARSVTLTVTDASNNVVWTDTKAMTAGDNSYSWNGRTSTGTLAPDGSYKLTATAIDTAGSAMAANIQLKGVVDSVEMVNGATMLKIGDYSVALDKVTSISTQ